MVFGLLYPNPKHDKKKLILLMFIYVTIMPLVIITGIDMYDCFMKRDLENLTRHSAVIIPFCVVNIKIFLIYLKRKECLDIINEINVDHERLNEMSDDYKKIADEKIKVAKYFQVYWTVIVSAVVLVYPGAATLQTMYSFCFDEDPVRYMVHDTKKPFAAPEDRLTSPFYEFMFMYTCYSSLFYLTSFLGYDGFFGVAVHHACLKMRVYCRDLEKAFEHAANKAQLKKQIADVIRAQCHTFGFVDTIQNVFNAWLGIIFIVTVIQLSNCMFQIIEGTQVDIRYLFFLPGTIVHIFLPCWNASVLKDMSEENATSIYFCGWEKVNDLSIRKTVMFMMARAQRSLEITAFNMFTFDMELFVSLLRTSYSMFTLLRS